MDTWTRDIKALLHRHRQPGCPRGIPVEARQQVGAWLRARHADGMNWADLGRELGVSRTSARNWSLEDPPTTTLSPAPGFLPVTLDPEAEPELPPTPVLWSPHGYRVEGLSLEDLMSLLRVLG